MSRSNRRPLVVGAVAVSAALATGLLSACSAGQIAQTAQVEPGVPGVNTQAAGYAVFIRNAALDYPGPKGYPAGASASLSLWIVNTTQQSVSLVRVTSGNEPLVASAGKNTAAPCVVPRSAGSSSPGSAPSSSSAPSPSGSGRASSSASSSSSPSASPSPSPAGSTTFKVTIPAGGCVELSRRAAQYLQVAKLPDTVLNSEAVPITFEFSTEDGQRFTIGDGEPPLRLPVSVPDSPLPRPTPSKGE